MPKRIPDWLITTAWSIAAIFGGGIWYFLGVNNGAGTIVIILVTAALTIITIMLHVKKERLQEQSKHVPVTIRLLNFIWDYPLLGEKQASWAVKESAVLLGDLGMARDHPGLASAIITTELALVSFGEAANSRIERCISWGINQAEPVPPHRILVEVREQSDFVVERMKPDFRHTLAFGVILARTKKHYSYLESYLELALSNQRSDGSWPGESAVNSRPVFAAVYAIELLHLAATDTSLPRHIRDAIPSAEAKGLGWLMTNRTANALWSTESLREYSWNEAVATSWVLHRLARTVGVSIDGWRSCLDDALFAMIKSARVPQTWGGTEEAQRYRAEARIAAGARKGLRVTGLSPRSIEAAQRYLGAWEARAKEWANRLPSAQMDVATAAFLIWSLVPEEQLKDMGSLVLNTADIVNPTNSNTAKLCA